jgi:hypothetical protein
MVSKEGDNVQGETPQQPDQADKRKRELRKARNRRYYLKHREQVLARARNWAEQNPDRAAELSRKSSLTYFHKNHDRLKKERSERDKRKREAQTGAEETIVFDQSAPPPAPENPAPERPSRTRQRKNA